VNVIVVRRLKRWLAHSFQTRSWERLDSLPITRLDPRLRHDERWLEAGVAWLRAARDMRDRARYPLSVVLTMSLREQGEARGVTFRNPRELAAEMDDEPPAISLAPPGSAFLEEAEDVHPGLCGLDPAEGFRCLLREWTFPAGAGGGVYRSVLIVGDPPPHRA
jgi:hypothetical protein